MSSKTNKQLTISFNFNILIFGDIMKHNIKIHYFEELESTNTTLKDMAKNGADESTVVIVESQTNGKGRLGRSFSSQKGGLYMSILLKPDIPPEEALQITVCAAAATAEAIETVSGKSCSIKWVNDLFLDGKKICGILTQGAINSKNGKLDYAVLGIGINVYASESGFPEELKDIAGVIFKEKTETDIIPKLTEEILNSFFKYYDTIKEKNYMPEYRRRSFLIGKEISYEKDGESHNGTVLDINENAALVVKENDCTLELSAGEVSVKPKF